MDAVMVGTTLYPPRWPLPYEVVRLPMLAPDRAMFGISDRQEFEGVYRAKLDGLGIEMIVGRLAELSAGGSRPLVLLCFEDIRLEATWCHREILADWLGEHGIEVAELGDPSEPKEPKPKAERATKEPKQTKSKSESGEQERKRVESAGGRKVGKRAPNGMGNLQQHPAGHWEGRVSYRKPDGSRGRKTVTAKTMNECRDKMLGLLADLQAGRPIGATNQTVEEYLKDWLENSVKPRRSVNTYRNYKEMVDYYIDPWLGWVKLDKLTGQDIEKWQNQLRQQKVKRAGRQTEKLLSARTVQLSHAVLRAALNRAAKLKLIRDNPASYVDAPSARRQEVRPLDFEQAHKLLAAVKGTRLEALWSVAITCGLRPGEALGLRWSDVDWKKGTLTIRQQLQRNLEGKLALSDLKTPKGRRVIHLPSVVLDALRKHHTRQLEEVAHSWKWEKSDLIFCTEGAKKGTVGGKPLIRRNVLRLLQSTLEAAGLPHQRLYDLRHLCASLLLAQGASMREIMEILGHSQMTLTSDTYVHIFDEQGKASAERMNKFLSGGQADAV